MRPRVTAVTFTSFIAPFTPPQCDAGITLRRYASSALPTVRAVATAHLIHNSEDDDNDDADDVYARRSPQHRLHLQQFYHSQQQKHSEKESVLSGRVEPRDQTALRQLYHIATPPDVATAVQLANRSAAFLQKWLTLRPIADHTRMAFLRVAEWRKPRAHRPLILDSGCGTGRSAATLARLFPDHDIVAVDRNTELLRKSPLLRPHPQRPSPTPFVEHNVNTLFPNVALVRADLVDFWRLAYDAGWTLSRHFILYPNPCPKPSGIKARLYGQPCFPIVLALGGTLEVRASWESYCVDFAAAVQALVPMAQVDGPHPLHISSADDALTNFEAKYYACGQPMFRLSVHLTPSDLIKRMKM